MENEPVPDSKKNRHDFGLYSAVALAVLGIGAIFFPYYWLDGLKFACFVIKIDKYENLGQFISGVSTPLISLSAFVLLWKTYTSQREELKQSREEFRIQNETLRLQRFENTFFQMVQLHADTISSLSQFNEKGRLVLNSAKIKLSAVIYQNRNRDARQFVAVDYYDFYYKEWEGSFNNLFRHLYHTYKFIYFSNLSKKEKQFYADLLSAQLSQDELFLIAFNGVLEGYGNPNFLYLIREYNILRNLRSDEINPSSFWDFISESTATVDYPFDLPKPPARNID